MLANGEIEQAKAILATAPDGKKDDPLLRKIEAQITLKEETAKLGDPLALAKRIQDNPKDYQAQFDLALIRNAEGKRDEAADLLLTIMKAIVHGMTMVRENNYCNSSMLGAQWILPRKHHVVNYRLYYFLEEEVELIS